MATARKKATRKLPKRKLASKQSAMSDYMPQYYVRKDPNILLIVLIIVLVFFIGFLFFKVQNLEKVVTGGNIIQQVAQQQPAPNTKVDVGVGHLPVMGNNNAPVTLIEFADFQCPFCKQWFKTVEPNLVKDYVNTGKVKIYYRHYAFLGDESTWAAEGSECANEQGKFWDFHDYLLNRQNQENSGTFSKANLEDFATQLGLNTALFNNCLETDKYAQQIKADLSDGQKAGVQGTPATFVNGYLIDGAQPYGVFKFKIDAELKKLGK